MTNLPWLGAGQPEQPGHTRPTQSSAGPASPSDAPADTPAGARPAGQGQDDAGTFYAEIGGHPTFQRIVHRFYQEVAVDPILRPLYPEADLGPAEVRLRMFLEQYWGGPRTYSQQRGHPRLRMRHVPFVIGPAERDAWLRAMRTAVDEAELTKEQDERLWNYLVMAANMLVNSPG